MSAWFLELVLPHGRLMNRWLLHVDLDVGTTGSTGSALNNLRWPKLICQTAPHLEPAEGTLPFSKLLFPPIGHLDSGRK